MQNFDLRTFSSIYYRFSAARLTSTRTIWVSENYRKLHPGKDLSAVKHEFNDRFSYAIPGGETFDDLEFDLAQQVECYAERYGGVGIANNGGGARCGDIGSFQVKGIGKNPLAAKRSNDVHHTYGGFKAVYAINEAIYAHIINRIAPAGAAEIYGVTLLGPKSAYVKDTERGWGAQLVREKVLRPASFMRAWTFEIDQARYPTMLSDVGRVRSAHVSAWKTFGHQNAVMDFLIELADRIACQMSFARIARLMHGAVSPSNMCLDGRWLDLTNTTFCCSTKNYAGGNRNTPSFYEELWAIPSIMEQLAKYFVKYMGLALPVREIKEHYRNAAREGLTHHLSYIFGLDEFPTGALDRAETRSLRDVVMRALSSGKVSYGRWPETYPQDDNILTLIQIFFTAAFLEEQFGGISDGQLDEQHEHAMASIAPFLSYMRHAHQTRCYSKIAYKYYLIVTAIVSIKRCVLPAYFYKGRMESVVNTFFRDNDIESVERFLYDSVEVADWAFSGLVGDEVVVLKAPSIEIRYSLVSSAFLLLTKNAPSLLFKKIGDLCGSIGPELTKLHGYDFDFYLKQLSRATDGIV
jgi:hypothetical protein